MTSTALGIRPATLVMTMGAACLALCTVLMLRALPEIGTSGTADYDPGYMVLVHATLPRLAMAMLCGAALAVSGAIMQQVLRNPLASPTTLGVDAGARLALALAGAFAPALIGFGRDLVALAGSFGALALVFAVSRGRAFSALNLILAGLVVGLYCGALSVVVTLANDRYLVGLFVWGSGSLSVTGWEAVTDLLLRVVLAALPLLWLWRPLEVLEIGDAASQGVGVGVTRLRAIAIAIAVMIAAFVTASVGVIGFIGLCAPLIARLAGARRFRERILWSAAIGALLLLLADAGLQAWGSPSGAFLPTGAVTALLGSPLLLLLLPKLRFLAPPPTLYDRTPRRRRAVRRSTLFVGTAFLIALLVATLAIGRGADGSWTWLSPEDFETALPWRAPRWAAACAAGAMLAVAGLILQRLTGNPMASPEILGISAGAILAVALTLYVLGSVGASVQYATATLGGMAVLALILALSRRSGFTPERVLLAGIALTALIDAVVGVLSATGDPNAFMLLGWLAGSTSGTTAGEAIYALLAAVVLIGPAFGMTRWIGILPLGEEMAGAIGVPTARARLALLGLAALLTAAATPIIGPLTFIGLIAPTVVAALGVVRPVAALSASILAGSGLMAAADFAARTIAFPILLPTGVTAALVSGPLLLFLLRKRMAFK